MPFQENHPTCSPTCANKMVTIWIFRTSCFNTSESISIYHLHLTLEFHVGCLQICHARTNIIDKFPLNPPGSQEHHGFRPWWVQVIGDIFHGQCRLLRMPSLSISCLVYGTMVGKKEKNKRQSRGGSRNSGMISQSWGTKSTEGTAPSPEEETMDETQHELTFHQSLSHVPETLLVIILAMMAAAVCIPSAQAKALVPNPHLLRPVP